MSAPYTPPGRFLADAIAARGMTQGAFAAVVGISQKHLSQLIHGRSRWSVDLAVRFERVTRIKAERWITMQAKDEVRQARARLCGEADQR